MPKINYNPDRRFTQQWADMIDTANQILEDYEKQGFDLTLRGLYYKFVGLNLFPEDRKFARVGNKWKRHPEGTKNADPNYKWLGEIVNEGRLAGRIDWNHLVDRTRVIKDLTHFEDEGDAVRRAHGWYHIDFWENQKIRPYVWVEKDAQVGNMVGVCQELDVPLFSCRGYTSQSAMWRAARRLLRDREEGYTTHIIHLGDHDPSGIDMSRDIFDRMEMFMGGTEFTRIALNLDQVKAQDLPPDPAKVTDSRAKSYVTKFGDDSWEMDALEPAFLNDLIRKTIVGLRDDEQWEADTKRYKKAKNNLSEISRRFPQVQRYLTHGDSLIDGLKKAEEVLAPMATKDKAADSVVEAAEFVVETLNAFLDD